MSKITNKQQVVIIKGKRNVWAVTFRAEIPLQDQPGTADQQ
jgi:hypothetical protein